MVANTAPIFSEAAHIEWGVVTTANTAKDGTGTVVPVFTAGADGSFLQKIVVRPKGTNVASVLRVFLNNGLTNATAGNNTLIHEVGLPATTNSEVAALAGTEASFNFPIPTGYVVNVTLGTTVAGGYSVTAIGGDY